MAQSAGKIYLLPAGEPDAAVVESLSVPLEKRFGFPCALARPIRDIEFAYDPSRNQYFCTALIRKIGERIPEDALRMLGIAGVDLFVPQLNFVFGEALMNGKVAVISLYRLDPRRYGDLGDTPRYLERTLKEAVHELGHTFGLEHCRDSRCVMFFSNSLLDTDRKGSEFCPACDSKIRRIHSPLKC
ncbi:MAG: archaemetzincin family Zn-dependent metalloprotease [Spirochaetaceae bacterium]|nr:MAG: archaemetzincin family Zn-dependent metalloprotease [Spirochaetaceae bacterium]